MRLDYEVLDLRVTLTIDEPALAEVVEQIMTDLARRQGYGWSADCEIHVLGSRPWRIAADGAQTWAYSRGRALAETLAAVNAAAVLRTPLLAFHAAVVTRQGHTLVIPARSGMGKSTLTACLLRHGWAYVSDEALALECTSGAVVPYPRPIALSTWSCAAVGAGSGVASEGEMLLRPVDLGASVDADPASVSHVVLLERSPAAERPSSAPIDRNEALAELLRRGFTHHRDGARALAAVVDVLRTTSVSRLRLGDPMVAAAHVTAMVDAA